MGNRLSKIVTRTGDAGTTGLGDGSRIGKDSQRIDALGEVDELNSMLGVLLAEELPEPIRTALVGEQHDLFDLRGELCIPGASVIGEAHISRLRSHIESMKTALQSGGSIGRKLDFIAQEMNREANTILSKANNIEISDVGINLKTGIEKIREQIQNIE